VGGALSVHLQINGAVAVGNGAFLGRCLTKTVVLQSERAQTGVTRGLLCLFMWERNIGIFSGEKAYVGSTFWVNDLGF